MDGHICRNACLSIRSYKYEKGKFLVWTHHKSVVSFQAMNCLTSFLYMHKDYTIISIKNIHKK